ncbi:MAG: glycosyl transferase, partial [Pseudomonadota bacterium]
MKVALFTPMKPPDHPVPSGDRTFARLIKRALVAAGHTVSLPSTLTTWRKTPEGLEALVQSADEEGRRIAASWEGDGPPDAILTYHNYHKAPDLLGRALAERFGLPYAI